MNNFSVFEHATLSGISHGTVMTGKHFPFMFIHVIIIMGLLIEASTADSTIKAELSRVYLLVTT